MESTKHCGGKKTTPCAWDTIYTDNAMALGVKITIGIPFKKVGVIKMNTTVCRQNPLLCKSNKI